MRVVVGGTLPYRPDDVQETAYMEALRYLCRFGTGLMKKYRDENPWVYHIEHQWQMDHLNPLWSITMRVNDIETLQNIVDRIEADILAAITDSAAIAVVLTSYQKTLDMRDPISASRWWSILRGQYEEAGIIIDPEYRNNPSASLTVEQIQAAAHEIFASARYATFQSITK